MANMKNLRLFKKIENAVFISRPNRFTILCNLNGKQIKAYLPNPGRLWELLLPGVSLFVEKTDKVERKMPYTVVAVKKEGRPVMLHTHKTNDAARFLIENNQVPGLEGTMVIKKEIKKGRSRFDFLLRKGPLDIYLEVKSCTLFSNKFAMFPDAPTSRGKRHLDELASISNKTTLGVVLFIINSSDPEFFVPDFHTDLNFSSSLYLARKKIMIIPLAIKWRSDLTLSARTKLLKVPWNILKKEAIDGGSYLLILRLSKKTFIEIGSLGKIKFNKGFYVYVGSAMKNLSTRIERHKRLRKKMFWHIDYFRAKAEISSVIPIRTSDDLECKLAGAMKKIADREILGFGSSDCSCRSHFFEMKANPVRTSCFQELLQFFKMERLSKLIL